jgi:hypothetical protein
LEFEQQPIENPETGNDATPHPRVRLHQGFSSIYLPDARDIIVYLPPGYDEEGEQSYPVL